MEHIKTLVKLNGCDIGFSKTHGSPNIHPSNGEGRVGKEGIDKNYTLTDIINLAYKMKEKPNVIVKAGPKAKWYMKKVIFDPIIINNLIQKEKWRDTSRSIMWIIKWDEEKISEEEIFDDN